MSYYRICPFCHCNLDLGEKCDCQQAREHQFHTIKETEAERKTEPKHKKMLPALAT